MAALGTYGAASHPTSTRILACRNYPLLTRGCRRSALPMCPLPEVDDRTGEGAGDAVDRLHPRDHQFAELVQVACLGADDHVIGAGDGLGLLYAGDVDDLRGDLGRLADLGLDEDVCRHHKQRPPWSPAYRGAM